MKRITESELRKLKSEIATKFAEIPSTHTRERNRLAGDLWLKALVMLPDDNTEVSDNIGERAVYWCRGNQGTSKWPSYYTKVDFTTTIQPGERRSNLCVIVPDGDLIDPALKVRTSTDPRYEDPIMFVVNYLKDNRDDEHYVPAIVSELCEFDTFGNLVFSPRATLPGEFTEVVDGARVTNVRYVVETEGDLRLFDGDDGDKCTDVVLDYLERNDVDPRYMETVDDVIDFIDDIDNADNDLRIEVIVSTENGYEGHEYYGRWCD